MKESSLLGLGYSYRLNPFTPRSFAMKAVTLDSQIALNNCFTFTFRNI